jgi:hypothetical protein
MPAHAAVTVIVDGALDQEEVFTDYLRLEEFLSQVGDDAESDGYLTEVFVLEHDHEIGIECECAQYALDHRPTYVFNSDATL